MSNLEKAKAIVLEKIPDADEYLDADFKAGWINAAISILEAAAREKWPDAICKLLVSTGNYVVEIAPSWNCANVIGEGPTELEAWIKAAESL